MEKKKILVVDDDSGIRAMIERLLTLKGYAVVMAGNGSECMRQVQESKPDLILLDIGMPHVGGMSALSMLKSDPQMRHIPVIVVSGEVASDKTELAAKLGGDDFVKKPFKSDELLNRIQRHLMAMDFAGLKSALLNLGPRDPGLSMMASMAGGRDWDVHVVSYRGVDARVMVPKGFEAKDARNLDEKGARERVIVIANMIFSWKRLWPAMPESRERSADEKSRERTADEGSPEPARKTA